MLGRESWPEVDDATLVVRAQERDPVAFELLVRRYQLRLYRLAVQLLGDHGEAEDVVQEAFISAWRQLPGFRGEAAFFSWMYRIVTNRCLNTTRSRRPTVPLEELSQAPSAWEKDSPERAAAGSDLRVALQRALAGLPAGLRVCWVLREVDGLSYTQIADIVGASPDAVRGRIYRARTRLAEVMRPWQ